MKVIFLDFDGVLNTLTHFSHEPKFSPSAIKHLNHILDAVPGVKIVVSSSWRHKGLAFCKKALIDNGIPGEKVVDIDYIDHHESRGFKIQDWLNDHKEVKKFVILDDRSDMDQLMKYLVKINPFVGLTEKDAKAAIEMLK